MECENWPIQVIVHCGTGGELLPLRFRYEDGAHCLHTVHIRQVTDSRRVEYVGIPAILYLCKAFVEGKEHLYELKYTIQTHKWVLCRRIY